MKISFNSLRSKITPVAPPPILIRAGFWTYNKNFAFTLAEVLITLAIIGIVAALTIPTLISNYQKKAIITKLKKANAVLSQVITRSVYDNGSMAQILKNGEDATRDAAIKYFNTYWIPYFNNPQIDSEGSGFPTYGTVFPWKTLTGNEYSSSICTNYDAFRIYFKTKDGIGYFIYAMSWDIERDENGNIISQRPKISSKPEIFVDINAGQGPNIIGKDIFYFVYDAENNSLYPFGHTYNDASINSNCNLKATSSYPGYACLEKIIRDNWEITYW